MSDPVEQLRRRLIDAEHQPRVTRGWDEARREYTDRLVRRAIARWDADPEDLRWAEHEAAPRMAER